MIYMILFAACVFVAAFTLAACLMGPVTNLALEYHARLVARFDRLRRAR
jgi:hypothetical protein